MHVRRRELVPGGERQPGRDRVSPGLLLRRRAVAPEPVPRWCVPRIRRPLPARPCSCAPWRVRARAAGTYGGASGLGAPSCSGGCACAVGYACPAGATSPSADCAACSTAGFACLGGAAGAAAVTVAIETLSSDNDHSCGVRADNSLACWGLNRGGEVTGVPTTGAYMSVSVGYVHACALRVDGTAVCWGTSTNNRLAAPAGAMAWVGVGRDHACGIMQAGRTIDCWGDDAQVGGLLLGAHVPTGAFSLLAVGDSHNCAQRVSDQAVLCWGANTLGEVSPVPSGLSGSPLALLAVGDFHSCAQKADGISGVVCWGDDGAGQLNAPAGVPLAQLHCDESDCCGVVAATGRAVCWGRSAATADAPIAQWAGLFLGGSSLLPTAAPTSLALVCGVMLNGTGACWINAGISPPAMPSGLWAAPCGAGVYGTGGAAGCFPCPAGRYGNAMRLWPSNSTCSGVCPAATYCAAGSAAPSPCAAPLGRFCGAGAGTAAGALCGPGAFCAGGIAAPAPCACAPGYACASGAVNASGLPVRACMRASPPCAPARTCGCVWGVRACVRALFLLLCARVRRSLSRCCSAVR